MSSKFKLLSVEPTQEMLDAITTERKKGNGALQCWYAAFGAAPQSPALGGEPEVLVTVDQRGVIQRKGVLRSVELIDRAHLAPLQAELDAYKASRERLHEWLREEQLKNIHLTGKVKELLHEAYEAGYCDAQNNPNGIGDRAERDKAAEQLMAEHIAALSKPAGSEQ